MGRIFGIADLPATIFTTPLEPVDIPKPVDVNLPRKILGNASYKHDVFVTQNMAARKSLMNRLVNGFRKIL